MMYVQYTRLEQMWYHNLLMRNLTRQNTIFIEAKGNPPPSPRSQFTPDIREEWVRLMIGHEFLVSDGCKHRVG